LDFGYPGTIGRYAILVTDTGISTWRLPIYPDYAYYNTGRSYYGTGLTATTVIITIYRSRVLSGVGSRVQ